MQLIYLLHMERYLALLSEYRLALGKLRGSSHFRAVMEVDMIHEDLVRAHAKLTAAEKESLAVEQQLPLKR